MDECENTASADVASTSATNNQAHTRGAPFRFIQEDPSLKIAALKTVLSKEATKILNHFIVVSEDKIRIRPIK